MPDSKFARLLTGVLCVVEGAGGTAAFVLQQKGPYAGSWLVPGGGLELGETAEAAFVGARRQLRCDSQPPNSAGGAPGQRK